MKDDVTLLVEVLRRRPSDTAILLDFDGTLAPIVDDPTAAVPLPGVAEALSALHALFGVVAVVSGRPLEHLRAHLPEGPTLVGLYGLEIVRNGAVVTPPEGDRWRRTVDDLATAASAELPRGVVVEHKGLSLTLHVREHPGLAPQVVAWAEAAAGRSGFHMRTARMSAELHPPAVVDKGTVITDLISAVGAACFIGDDVGDLPAFDALDAFEARGGTALRLAVHSSELDATMRRRADALLDGPPAVLDLLRALTA
ncbi:MAG: trehalose-phosphatase [Acidimicrobiales bacterium]